MKLMKIKIYIVLNRNSLNEMKYLIEKEKCDITRIEFKNGRVAHVLINYISDDIYEVNLNNVNAKFYEIDKVKFVNNN